MLTANQLRQVAAGSGARDIGNVEIDVILTYLLQLFSEKGVTDHVAFKGGTMLRKMVFGPRGRLAPESIEGARPAEAPGMQELVRCFDIPLHPEDGGHCGALCCGLPILQEAFFLSWNSPVAWRTCSPIAFSVPGSSMLPDEEGIGNTCAGFLAAVQAVLPHVPDSIARAC